ncbi:MAG: GlxA family transcriptional regulator [Kiloniellales bacterium]
MFAEPTDEIPQRIGFVLIPNFSMIAFTSAIEALRLANRHAERRLYDWRLLSVDGAAVAASNGITLMPDGRISELESYRTVIVCSGIDVERFDVGGVKGWLHRLDRLGADIGALCTGAHLLARAGVLQGYRCTIHWENLSGFLEEFPDIEVSTDLFEIDRNRFTCSGGTAAIDLMLYVIAKQHGEALATTVSEQLILDRIRDPHDRQRLPLGSRLRVNNPKLIEAIGLMESHLEDQLSQEHLARSVGLSRRQLERLFRRHLGRSPARYYLALRLDRARLLLHQTDMSVIDVALACGFISASHFSKCYRQIYGRSPRAERTLPRVA